MDISEQAGAGGCQLPDPLESSIMERLPDEMLLMVMQYLDVEDLFRCRLVSKRLEGLAVDPDVWWYRALDCDRDPWACAVLRLAPQINLLNLRVPATKACHRALLSRTECAVGRLDVFLNHGDGVEEIQQLVDNQDDLGCLVGLDLCVKTEMDGATATELLDLLVSIEGLEELRIDILDEGAIPTSASPTLNGVYSPSLRQFELSWFNTSPDSLPQAIGDVCRFVLAKHAATLERVEFSSTPSITLPAPLLASMPNLRALHCTSFPGMSALAASASLSELELRVTPETVDRDTRHFLRHADQLRDVTLEFSSPEEDDDDPDSTWLPTTAGVDMVVDLASSGRSRVERLCISNAGQYFPQEPSLLRALPMLRGLRHLIVDSAPDELLIGITPTTAPALQTFEVSETNWGCTHAWLHREVVKLLLSANPSLHVHIMSYYHGGCEPLGYCEVCREYDCHPQLCKLRAAIFFTHEPEHSCSLPEIHESDFCFHVSDVSALETTVEVHETMGWSDWRGL